MYLFFCWQIKSFQEIFLTYKHFPNIFLQNTLHYFSCPPKQGTGMDGSHTAIGGGGECMSGGAAGAGGEGWKAGTNIVKDTQKDKDAKQEANGGKSNGGYGGNANGDDGLIR